jgi:superfamily II DNA or RNA helicase
MHQATGVTGTDSDGILTTEQQHRWDRRQQKSVRAVTNHWKRHGYSTPYPLIAAATGYGKGRVTAELLKKLKRPKVLLVAGTKHMLAKQSKRSLSGYLQSSTDLASVVTEETGQTNFEILGSKEYTGSAGVDVSIWQRLQSFHKRGMLVPYGLTIIDEAHNAGTQDRIDLLKALETEAVVGLSATAFRSSGKFKTPESYGFKVVDTVSLVEGIEGGWNSPFLGLAIDPEMVLSRDTVDLGEISLTRLYREMRKHPEYLPNVAKVLAENFLIGRNGKPGPKTVIPINRVVEEGVILARELRKYGITVGLAVNQQASKKWEHEFSTFDAIDRHQLPHNDPQAIQVVLSPGVIGEGYDNPAIELIAWVVPTLSATRYTQVMGRGARMCRGKAYCLVVDFPWFIEGYGYSLTFGQFFRKEEMKEVKGGYIYVGSSSFPLHSSAYSMPQGMKVIDVMRQTERVYPDSGDWLTLSSIAHMLQCGVMWVAAQLSNLGVEGEERRSFQGPVYTHYPPEVVDKIRFIRDEAPDKADWMTVTKMASILEKPEATVQKALSMLKAKGEKRRNAARGHTFLHYPPKILDQVRIELSKYSLPLPGEITKNALGRALGRGDKWIDAKAKELAIVPQIRRTSTGNFHHYPPEALGLLRKLTESYKELQEGELAAAALGELIGKSAYWVESTATRLGIKTTPRIMPGKQVHLAYPAGASDLLVAEYNKYPEAQPGECTLQDLVRDLGKNRTWIERRLNGAIEAELRWAPNGCLYNYYPASAREVLKELL